MFTLYSAQCTFWAYCKFVENHLCLKLVRVDKVAKYTETPRTLFLHPQDKRSWLVLPVDLHAGPDTKTLSDAHLIRALPRIIQVARTQ